MNLLFSNIRRLCIITGTRGSITFLIYSSVNPGTEILFRTVVTYCCEVSIES